MMHLAAPYSGRSYQGWDADCGRESAKLQSAGVHQRTGPSATQFAKHNDYNSSSKQCVKNSLPENLKWNILF